MEKVQLNNDKLSQELIENLIASCLLFELPDAVFLIDPKTSDILYANKLGYESLGMLENEVVNHSVTSLQVAVVNQPHWSEIANVITQAKEPYVFLGRHKRKDGSCFPVEVRTSNLYYQGKHFFISVARDVTFRQIMDNELLEHKHSLWYALNEASDGLWEWNIEKDSLYVSPKLKQMRGYGPEEDASTVDFWVDGIHPDDKSRVLAIMQEHLQGRTDKFEAKYRLRTRVGHFIWVNDCGKVSKRDNEGNPAIVAGMVQNITDQVILQERLENQAARDELTGAYNRRVCREILEEKIKYSIDNDTAFAVVLLDIDYFKSINDQHGHQVGDVVLKAFVDKINEHLKYGDTLFRWGGEEFLLILSGENQKEQFQYAENIRKAIESHTITLADSTEISLTISLGISTCPYHGTTLSQLISRADIAMYRAKANGRNKSELFK